ncbi:MAG: DUF1402 family protein [Halobacteriovoraceae bacterium]|jgi:hypothetical protein|nr:DUF1402 family protein [Halobacteriovoraceae bacterium]
MIKNFLLLLISILAQDTFARIYSADYYFKMKENNFEKLDRLKYNPQTDSMKKLDSNIWNVLRLTKDKINFAADLFPDVEPEVITACILAENSMNVQLDDEIQNWLQFNNKAAFKLVANIFGKDPEKVSLGIGQIQTYVAFNVEPLLAKAENRPPVKGKYSIDIQDPASAYKYAAAIIQNAINIYRENGFDISKSPEIQCTLYNIGKVEKRVKRSLTTGKAPKPNYFGFYVDYYMDKISAEFKKKDSDSKPPKPDSSLQKLTKKQSISSELISFQAPSACNSKSDKNYENNSKISGFYTVLDFELDCNLNAWTSIMTNTGDIRWIPSLDLQQNSKTFMSIESDSSEIISCLEKEKIDVCKEKIFKESEHGTINKWRNFSINLKNLKLPRILSLEGRRLKSSTGLNEVLSQIKSSQDKFETQVKKYILRNKTRTGKGSKIEFTNYILHTPIREVLVNYFKDGEELTQLIAKNEKINKLAADLRACQDTVSRSYSEPYCYFNNTSLKKAKKVLSSIEFTDHLIDMPELDESALKEIESSIVHEDKNDSLNHSYLSPHQIERVIDLAEYKKRKLLKKIDKHTPPLSAEKKQSRIKDIEKLFSWLTKLSECNHCLIKTSLSNNKLISLLNTSDLYQKLWEVGPEFNHLKGITIENFFDTKRSELGGILNSVYKECHDYFDKVPGTSKNILNHLKNMKKMFTNTSYDKMGFLVKEVKTRSSHLISECRKANICDEYNFSRIETGPCFKLKSAKDSNFYCEYAKPVKLFDIIVQLNRLTCFISDSKAIGDASFYGSSHISYINCRDVEIGFDGLTAIKNIANNDCVSQIVIPDKVFFERLQEKTKDSILKNKLVFLPNKDKWSLPIVFKKACHKD